MYYTSYTTVLTAQIENICIIAESVIWQCCSFLITFRFFLFLSVSSLSVVLISWMALLSSVTHFSIMFFSILLCFFATNLSFCIHFSRLCYRLATSSLVSHVSPSSFTCSLVKVHLYLKICHELPFIFFFLEASNLIRF